MHSSDALVACTRIRVRSAVLLLCNHSDLTTIKEISLTFVTRETLHVIARLCTHLSIELEADLTSHPSVVANMLRVSCSSRQQEIARETAIKTEKLRTLMGKV